MEARWLSVAVAVLLLFITAMGCSSNGSLTIPSLDAAPAPGHSGAGNTVLLGLYQFIIDKDTNDVQIVTLREADKTLNVLGFMEPPPLKNLNIDFKTLKINSVAKTISVDVIFTHPFVTTNGDYMGFDVRGVVFGPQVTNADGYTPLVNPADFSDVPFGYIDGLLGTPNGTAHYDADYWGYKYFADGLGLNASLYNWLLADTTHRGAFNEGQTNKRHYELSWAGDGYPYNFFVFNYAVVASYDWPSGEGPFDLGDFPITTANAAEAFCIAAFEISNTLYFDGETGGGDLDLDVEVFDWQGLDNTEVKLQSIPSGLIDTTTVTAHDPGNTPVSGIFHFVDVAGHPVATGNLDLLITATDKSETYGSSWFLGLLPKSHSFYNKYVYSLRKFAVDVKEVEPEIEMYWYPVEGQTRIPLSPAPNQGSRNSDLGVFSAGDNQSRGTTLNQSAGAFTKWNNGYTAQSGTFPWYFGSYYGYYELDDVNHFDTTIDGTQCQAISYNQTIFDPVDYPYTNSSTGLMLDTSTGFLPNDSVVWLVGLEPSAYWLDFADASGAVIGYDESVNGADDNMYFIASYSTEPQNPALHGAWDGNYYFFRWLSPYITDTDVYIDGLAIWGLSTQTPGGDGLVDIEPREHRLGVDDNTGTYFTNPTHSDTDWAEFFYILDNDDNLHMCVVEFDDPIAFLSIGWVLPENWNGDAVDVEVAPAYTGTTWSPWGWSCVLVDKGDNTWTVMTLLWDITGEELAVYLLDETDPIIGKPLAIDADNTDFELHVLSKNGSNIEATVFKWYDNIPEG